MVTEVSSKKPPVYAKLCTLTNQNRDQLMGRKILVLETQVSSTSSTPSTTSTSIPLSSTPSEKETTPSTTSANTPLMAKHLQNTYESVTCDGIPPNMPICESFASIKKRNELHRFGMPSVFNTKTPDKYYLPNIELSENLDCQIHKLLGYQKHALRNGFENLLGRRREIVINTLTNLGLITFKVGNYLNHNDHTIREKAVMLVDYIQNVDVSKVIVMMNYLASLYQGEPCLSRIYGGSILTIYEHVFNTLDKPLKCRI